MPHIAIDANEANVANRVGSNVYAFEIISEIEKLTRRDQSLSWTVLISQSPRADLPKARKNWQYRVVKPAPFWTQWALPLHLYLHQQEYDLFFTPGHYGPSFSPIPIVSSVMDLAYLHFPAQFRRKDWLQLTKWTAHTVKQAKHVVTISQATKQDLLEQYDLATDAVSVAYPGLRTATKLPSKNRQHSLLKKLSISQPYLVYVGTLQPRKNLIRLVEAFEELHAIMANPESSDLNQRQIKMLTKYSQLQLVIAGKVGWLADDILDKVAHSPVFDKIVMPGYVDETTKQVLYANAVSSILVGLYEGFGMPPLEAMAHGTIPIVSHNSSLPEVVGKAGIQVDPKDVHSITQGLIARLTLTKHQEAQLRKAAREQVKKFDWSESAELIVTKLKALC